MINGINNIRLEGLFTGFLQKHLVSFRTGKLPKDVHFTFVFDENLEDMNLHVSRNVTGESKPKIGIIKVNRELLLDVAKSLSLKMFYSLMEPIDMPEFLSNKDSVGFISLDDAESSGISEKLYKSWLKPFQDYSKVKGKRLSITGNYQKAFEDSIPKQLENQEALFDLLQPISEHYEKDVERGIIIADESYRFAARFYGQWYFFKTDFTIFDVLSGLTNRKTAYHIICKIEQALEVIQIAESYDDTKIYDKPLRLQAINPEDKSR